MFVMCGLKTAITSEIYSLHIPRLSAIKMLWSFVCHVLIITVEYSVNEQENNRLRMQQRQQLTSLQLYVLKKAVHFLLMSSGDPSWVASLLITENLRL